MSDEGLPRSGDRWSAVEDLLKAADHPAVVSRGLRCRVLQAASQAHTRRARVRQFVMTGLVTVVLFSCVTVGVVQLVRQIAPQPVFANWNSPHTPFETAAYPSNSPSSVVVPVEWKMVDSYSAMQESRSRAFGAGMFSTDPMPMPMPW